MNLICHIIQTISINVPTYLLQIELHHGIELIGILAIRSRFI